VLLNAEAGLLGFSSSKSDEVSTVRPGSKSLKMNSGNKFWKKKLKKFIFLKWRILINWDPAVSAYYSKKLRMAKFHLIELLTSWKN
jgi:hypothetical protein